MSTLRGRILVSLTLLLAGAIPVPCDAEENAPSGLGTVRETLGAGSPDGHDLVAYLDCGSVDGTGAIHAISIHQRTGTNRTFAGVDGPIGTTAVDETRVVFEVTGLDPTAEYVLGFSWQDVDSAGRKQSVALRADESSDWKTVLPSTVVAAFHQGKATYARVHLPVPGSLLADGRFDVSFERHAGPDALVGDLWLLRKTGDRRRKRVLIVTGDDYPGHLWRQTAPELAASLREDPRLEVTITESPAIYASSLVGDYDATILHFKDYEERLPIDTAVWRGLEEFISTGGGLVIVHFGCGAFQEWDGFVKVAGRVWNPSLRGHDPYGPFEVRISDSEHPVTRGLKPFTTEDELYTCLDGETPIRVLCEAKSKIDSKAHPMAFAHTVGQGRVFHSPLGHDAHALRFDGTRELYRRAAAWVAGLEPGGGPSWLWVYASVNFQVDSSIDRLIALLERAREAGYNGALVTDFKFGRIEDRPERYYDNLRRSRRAAERLGVELIPAVCPIGYSSSLLINNPDLAEGIAVRGCDFVVEGGKGRVANDANLLPFGDFEAGVDSRKALNGWDWHDGPGKSIFLERRTTHRGEGAARLTDFRKGNSHGNARLVKALELKPWHQYHASLWVKTSGLGNPGDLRVTILADDGRSLNHKDLGVEPTQDWRQHHVVFNTLEHADVRLYVGLWNGRDGTIYIDDIELRETAGVNLLRREGCPVTVTSADGRTRYVEGKDFERWEYAKMGRDPWPGAFKVIHPAPPIVLTESSRIRDEEHLAVSFYHTALIHDSQVTACLSHDETFVHMRNQIRQLHGFWSPKKYFLSHDEIRVAGQCELCRAGGRTAGEVLAANVKRCVDLVREIEPRAEVFVWSDMFDPHHNAVDRYYLVGSTLESSWLGLEPTVQIANWNFGRRDRSLAFFAGRGHRQIIAGYYDTSDVEGRLAKWLTSARKVSGVDGVIYTTWQSRYDDLEAFAEAVRRGW